MKIDAADPKYPGWIKHLFPCDCGSAEYLHISWWDDEEPWDGYLEVTPAIWAPGWRDRLKAIAKIIVGQPAYHGGIILNQETAGELLDLLATQRERQVNEDGTAEHTNKDEHIHQDTDS